ECTEGNLTELTTGICPGETFTFGDNQISSPGSYQASFTNQQGCDSLVFLNVEPLESPSVQLGPDTSISQNEVLDLSIFGSYFGIFWNDGTVGNEYIFSAETPGQYTISVTVYGFNGCPATDEIIINVEMVSSAATFTEAKPIQCKLFPNPASFGQSIQLLLENIPDRLQQIELIIYDAAGRKRIEKQHRSKSSISIDHSLEAGLYFVQLWSAGQMLSSQSFVVQ
ncbi:MAG: T9SS type A sorting domain-containing protein, partial [Saprospiraceae bacterium]|nr:T9SS type A sorting domain-containing protein [Saprospiraceae bacterium]